MLLDSQHPDAWQKIQDLEGLDKFPQLEYPETEFGKPQWVRTFENVDVEQEGEIVQLFGQVDPADDPNLKVEWFLNGVPLQNCELNRVVASHVESF